MWLMSLGRNQCETRMRKRTGKTILSEPEDDTRTQGQTCCKLQVPAGMLALIYHRDNSTETGSAICIQVKCSENIHTLTLSLITSSSKLWSY